jgi:hypothetical protein
MLERPFGRFVACTGIGDGSLNLSRKPPGFAKRNFFSAGAWNVKKPDLAGHASVCGVFSRMGFRQAVTNDPEAASAWKRGDFSLEFTFPNGEISLLLKFIA